MSKQARRGFVPRWGPCGRHGWILVCSAAAVSPSRRGRRTRRGSPASLVGRRRPSKPSGSRCFADSTWIHLGGDHSQSGIIHTMASTAKSPSRRRSCISDFEILGRLGSGSFGTVFKVSSPTPALHSIPWRSPPLCALTSHRHIGSTHPPSLPCRCHAMPCHAMPCHAMPYSSRVCMATGEAARGRA